MALFQYNTQFTVALSSHSGDKLAPLFKKNALSKFPNPNPITVEIQPSLHKVLRLDDYCRGQVTEPYDDMMALHFKAIIAIDKGQWVEAYGHQANLVQMFTKQFQAETTNWMIKPLNTICTDLRILAKQADMELKQKNMKEDKLEDAARLLNSCFSVCIRDGSPLEVSKKWGTLLVINNLFKIYFALNNLRLCKNLIRPVEAKGFPPVEGFPVSQIVTYKFYVGRLAMFEGQFQKAEVELSYAFKRCSKRNLKNKRLLLLYLIPVKILRGKMPTRTLLEKYNMRQFINVAVAVQTGNLKLFNDTLAENQEYFIQKGVFLILEQSKILTYRNLFKRVFIILKSSKIRLTQFEKIFQWMGINIDIDEIECILANLIYTGGIKGYISHQASCLVLSNNLAFPPWSSVLQSQNK